jgi:hypothetical protein
VAAAAQAVMLLAMKHQVLAPEKAGLMVHYTQQEGVMESLWELQLLQIQEMAAHKAATAAQEL